MRVLRVVTVGSILLMSTCVMVGRGQSRQNPTPVIGPPVNGSGLPSIGRNDSTASDPLGGRMEEQQVKSRNSERQKRLVADTDRLVTLVKELKEQVETSDKPLEPSDVGRRAEEIEKLAKSVKDRMKG